MKFKAGDRVRFAVDSLANCRCRNCQVFSRSGGVVKKVNLGEFAVGSLTSYIVQVDNFDVWCYEWQITREKPVDATVKWV